MWQLNIHNGHGTYLLLPILQLIVEVVVPLGHLGQFRVHAALEVDEILPGLLGVARVLVALAHNLVQMSHRNLRHQRLLHRSAEDSLHSTVAARLLADMVHNSHDSVLVPPLRLLDGLDFAAHNDDLTSRDQLTAAVGRAEMLWDTGRGDVTIESLGQSSDEFVALAWSQSRWGIGCEDEVSVEVDNKSVIGRSEKRSALGGNTEDVWTRFLHKLLCVTSVNDGDVQAAPFVNADAIADSFCGHGEYSRIVTDEDDAPSRRDCCLDDTHDVGDGQTSE
jgi:hypothetical protein